MKHNKVRRISRLQLPKIGKKPLRNAAKLLPSALKTAASAAGSLMVTEKNLKRLRSREEELERLLNLPRLQDITFIGSSNTKK